MARPQTAGSSSARAIRRWRAVDTGGADASGSDNVISAVKRASRLLDRQSRRVLNGGDDDKRLHVGDEFVVEELVAQEAVIGADILGDHLEEVVHRAGDALAEEHFRPELHHAIEIF